MVRSGVQVQVILRQAPLHQLLMCLFEPVNGSLATNPFHQLTHTVPKRHMGFIAEQGPGEGNVRVTVSDISLAEPSEDAWLQVRACWAP